MPFRLSVKRYAVRIEQGSRGSTLPVTVFFHCLLDDVNCIGNARVAVSMITVAFEDGFGLLG
jgi:hypothetical protein